jgi:hypothetical protein
LDTNFLKTARIPPAFWNLPVATEAVARAVLYQELTQPAPLRYMSGPGAHAKAIQYMMHFIADYEECGLPPDEFRYYCIDANMAMMLFGPSLRNEGDPEDLLCNILLNGRFVIFSDVNALEEKWVKQFESILRQRFNDGKMSILTTQDNNLNLTPQFILMFQGRSEVNIA